MLRAALLLIFIAFAFALIPSPVLAQKHHKTVVKTAAPEKNYDDSTADQLPVPEPIGLVSDYGHVFTKGQSDTLTQIIRTFKDSTKDEVVIIAWDTLHLDPDEMDAYVKKISDDWQIGDPQHGNGIIIAFSVNLRKIRIQNSTGGLMDQDSYLIVHKMMLPYFAVKNYYAGTLAGLNAVIKKLDE